MGIGTRSRELTYDKEPEATFNDLRRALETVGKVQEADPESFFLRGSTRFGLQKVRLKISIARSDQGSTVSINALADDVWGMGAKKGIERLIRALNEV